MPEFKFSCPQCGQNILCDTGYSGVQITCPSCNQAILVPQAPGYAAPPPAPSPAAPPASRTMHNTGAPAVGQRFAAAQPPLPPAKSNTLRNILVITACIILVAALGAGGWIGYSKYKANQALKKGNPAAMVTPPTATQSNDAIDLLTKVHNAYTNLTSLTISGTSVMALDMSQLTAADLNPNAKKTTESKRPRRGNIPKAITNTMDVTIKMERPNLYCMEGISKMSFGAMTMSNVMAAWSPGDTNYSLSIMGGGAYKRYTAVKDRNTALMGGGQTGGLAVGLMDIFFNDTPNGMDKFIQDWGQTTDDSVNGQDCYTITGKIFGQKIELWISKSSYMILQSQITLGAPVSNEDVDNAIDTFDTSTNQDQIAKDKAQAEKQAAMMTKLRGTLTDTYDDIQPNSTLGPDDFHYQVPRGVRLIIQ